MITLPDTSAKIPSQDRYGNIMTGSGYTNSHIVDSDGNVSSIYNGTSLDRTKVTRDYHWGLAIWNSVDAAADRIRSDVQPCEPCRTTFRT